MSRIKDLFHELRHHLPFTALATLIAIGIVLIVKFVLTLDVSKEAFGILHPLHVLVSGIATAGIFYKYRKNFIGAFLVGALGSLVIGTISDIIFPYLGAWILNLQPEFHLPIIHKPLPVALASVVGAIFGISTQTTKTSHSLHVFLTVFASLFYLMAFTSTLGIFYFIAAFVIVLIAVIVPCCVSDILFPFFFLGKKIKHCNCG